MKVIHATDRRLQVSVNIWADGIYVLVPPEVYVKDDTLADYLRTIADKLSAGEYEALDARPLE